ncbi:acyltransferase family protein [Labrys monachus]|uniref:Exopolysaccharide production protein ExoZ n=1 Tax=Labrys monachus TaxID=217067 RepID=A0ABU0F9L9_9HYPH|nr:acyltransferase [Labrys monachus]MDQ0391126.1 exopolysaccharide production protein ExoZ [Labrys monachus]
MKKGKIDAIQALRGVAALMVVARHSWESFNIGGAGVDLFFVISGFTMVYASKPMFGSGRSIFPFIERRLIRIYPVYWAATALIILLLGLPDMPNLIGSILLIPLADRPIINPGWTLIYEVFFYAIFAAMLCLPMRQAAAAVIGALLLVTVVGPYVPFISAYADPIVLDFAAGVLLGVAYCEGARLTRLPANYLLLAGILMVGLIALLGEFNGQIWLRLIAWCLPATLIFVALVFGPERKILKTFVLQGLGEASYSIYVFHWVVYRGFLSAPHHRPATFITSIFLGLGFFFAFERPVLAFLRTRFARLQPYPQASQAPATAIAPAVID